MPPGEPTKVRTENKVQFSWAFLITAGILLCLPSPGFAQQAKAFDPAAEYQQVMVSWLYGPYVPKDVPRLAMTPQNRLRLYERQSFTTPGIYLKSGLVGTIEQANGTPRDWGGGAEGYSRRVASNYGQYLIQNSFSAGGNALLQYEPRYDRCHCAGLGPRTRHALLRNLLTYNQTERELRPQFALYGAAFTSGMISSTWKPRSEVWRQGSYGMLTQAGFGSLSNWIGEFATEINRVLRGKK
jgi:hypothetical protein